MWPHDLKKGEDIAGGLGAKLQPPEARGVCRAKPPAAYGILRFSHKKHSYQYTFLSYKDIGLGWPHVPFSPVQSRFFPPSLPLCPGIFYSKFAFVNTAFQPHKRRQTTACGRGDLFFLLFLDFGRKTEHLRT